MKLSTDQITALKKLIFKKGYSEIDVQYEILDHVACKVEELLEEQPALKIEDAFQKVHASFGIFGFLEVEESYKKVIETRLRKYFWMELKSMSLNFKILIPLILTFCYFQFAFELENSFGIGGIQLGLVMIIFLVLFVLWWYFAFGRDFKKYKNYASWRGNQSIIMFAYLPLQFMIQGHRIIGIVNLLEPRNLGFWQIIAIAFVFIGFYALTALPSVFKKSLMDTKKLEKIYQTI
jgi:hypothetical protein